MDQNRSRPPLDILYEVPASSTGEEVEVDIIAVHGLGSKVDSSWTSKDDKHTHWLRDNDMLPAKVPRSRIIAYNYDSKWTMDASKTRLQLCGEELIHSIHNFDSESGAPNRPIIFVCHSLGGNVVVHSLLYANFEEKYRPLSDRVVGLVFLGTPFRGTECQPFLDTLAQLMGPLSSHRGITSELGFDAPHLNDKLHQFCRLVNKTSMPVACFRELYETDCSRGLIPLVAKAMVVKESSACIPGLDRYALQADHLNINKYDGPSNRSFQAVSAVISDMCDKAKDVLRHRQDPKPIITNRSHASKQYPEATACLLDLFVTDPLEDKNALKRKKGDRALGTCEWLLGTEELTTWLSSEQHVETGQTSKVLWLHGHPGTGKSTMAIFLTEELSRSFAKTDGKSLAYFFCDSGSEKRATATSVIRGLLLQLVQQHPQLLQYVLPKYNERGKQLFSSIEALWAIFMTAAADNETGRKYCVIDALDECDQDSQEWLVQAFQEFHSQDGPTNLRILIFSRPFEEISRYLRSCANQDLASFKQRNEDLDRCIHDRLNDLAEKNKYSRKIKDQALKILKSKAEGTFLWVGLACESLKRTPSNRVIKELESMPAGLHSLYETLLNKAVGPEKDNEQVFRRILGVVVVSLEPLSLLELSEACELHQDEEDEETRIQFTREQIESCRLLVVIQDEKVLLLHKSVKDFIFKLGTSYSIDQHEAHADLSYRCVDVLVKKFHINKSFEIGVGFLRYAVRYWARHASMAECSFEVTDSHGEFFAVHSPCREQWLRWFWIYMPECCRGRVPAAYSILHVAAGLDIPALVDYTLDQGGTEHEGTDINDLLALRCDDLTPLDEAISRGNLKSISCLLKYGGKFTEKGLIEMLRWLTHAKEVMSLLLDKRSDQITITEDLLIAAVKNQGQSEEVMALLLDKKSEQITITEEVVNAAARSRSTECMALLLNQRGDQIIITEEVVKSAARSMSAECLALLLDQRGDQITITEAVVKAAAGNWPIGNKLMALLLDRKGDQITITEAVVKAAAGNQYSGNKVMALLLDRKCDQITITEAVVKAAAGNWPIGNKLMALLLDRKGDQITITEAVVKAAAGNRYSGNKLMALLLDRKGDQITITEAVVKAAAGNRYSGNKVMALLLDRKGDQITITEEVVKAAAGNQYSGNKVMTLLLDHREKETAESITEEVLMLAATWGKPAFFDLFSQRCPQLRIPDKLYNISKFLHAAEFGDITCIKRLLDGGINPDVASADGSTPLWLAAFRGHDEIVDILARRADVDVNSLHDEGSLLHWASRHGHIGIVATLLEAGAIPDIADRFGDMPLSVAKASGHFRIAKMLEKAINAGKPEHK